MIFVWCSHLPGNISFPDALVWGLSILASFMASMPNVKYSFYVYAEADLDVIECIQVLTLKKIWFTLQ